MSKKIAIVGGGLSGLAAAYMLLESGSGVQEVRLFEAGGRYGGRARTDSTSISGFAFDMGAQYIQGPDQNPLKAIAEEMGYDTVEETADYLLRMNRGHGWETLPTTTPDVQDVVDEIQSSFDEARRWPNVRVARQPGRETQVELLGYATSTYGPFTESAEAWQYIAADRAREEVVDAGANLFVLKGIGALVNAYGERLSTKYPNQYTAKLQTPVTHLTHDSQGVTVTTCEGDWRADACIVTVPVDVLARGDIAFSPALPEAHRLALRVLRLGSYKKVAMALRGDPASIKPGTNYYLVNDEPSGVWQVYRLPHAPGVLVAHAAGNFARALDDLRDTDVYAMLRALMTEAFDGVFFGPGRAITNWSQATGAWGAYSYAAFAGGGLEDKQPLAARKTLAGQVGHLHFAGEALDPACYGTLQAAYFSGVEAALQVLG